MIFIPILISFSAALSLVLIRIFRSHFRFYWLIAVSSSILVLLLVLLWFFRIPFEITLPPWNNFYSTLYTPTWVINHVNWPIVLSIVSVGLAAILTSLARRYNDPFDLATIIVYSSLVLLAIASGNYITLAICWISIDLLDLITLMRHPREDINNGIILLFTVKLSGILFLLWSAVFSSSNGYQMLFSRVPTETGSLLLITSILRIGYLPIHLGLQNSNNPRNDFSIYSIFSSASGMVLLLHLPVNLINSNYLTIILTVIVILLIVFSIAWLFSKDESSGRPYWILCFWLLISTSALLGNINGIVSLITSFLLCGGLLFLYTNRTKRNKWIPILGLLSLSTLPFALNYRLFTEMNLVSIPLMVGYSILLAGYMRHSMSLKSYPVNNNNQRWEIFVHSTGLVILLASMIFFGYAGWSNHRQIQLLVIAFIPIGLAILFLFLFSFFQERISKYLINLPHYNIKFLSTTLWGIYYLIRRVILSINSILEGDGGMLWSLVILLLFVTIISSISQ